MKRVLLIVGFFLTCQAGFSQNYANDDNYFLIVLDGENAYINKTTGEVVKPGQVVKNESKTTTVLNPTISGVAGGSHIVEKGETLYAIARRYGVNVNDLKTVNGLTNQSILSIGQALKIPNSKITATPVKSYTPSSAGSYTVKKGDTLYSIARKFGKTVASIKSANQLTSNVIQPNQVLNIQ